MTAASLLVQLRARDVAVEVYAQRLRLSPADRVTPAELADLRTLKTQVIALLVDLESLERDGTAAIWRGTFEALPERDQDRLAREVAEGDAVACLLWLCLELPTIPLAQPARRGEA